MLATMTFPDFVGSRFERGRYAFVAIGFPSIVIITIVLMINLNINFDSDLQRTYLIERVFNNTVIGIQNTMVKDCEQDARIDFLMGNSEEIVKKSLENCLNQIPFHDDRYNRIEIKINEGDV